jgi:putative transposase
LNCELAAVGARALGDVLGIDRSWQAIDNWRLVRLKDMARPLRLQFADSIHHVMSRGIEGRRICVDRVDRNIWLQILDRAAQRFRWQVFAFCLLDNHYHLFLRTPEGGLSPGMRQLNGDYAGYFNRRHERLGPLMRGRYQSVLVENAGHWGELSRYVHLNPVRAGLCKRPEGWRWSSYRCYHRPALRPPWLDCKTVLAEFGKEERLALRAYRQFMEDGLGRKLDNPVSKAVHGLVLGSDAFVAKVRKMLAGRGPYAEVPGLSRLKRGVDLAAMVGRVAERLRADRSGWVPGRRTYDGARAKCAYAVREASGARNLELAAVLGYRSASAVTAACRRVRDAARSAKVRRELEGLIADAAQER